MSDSSHYSTGGPHFTLPEEIKMSDDELPEDKVPQPGDEFIYTDDEGNAQTGVVKTVNELDEDEGLFPITSVAGGKYRVYWSEDDDSWTDAGE